MKKTRIIFSLILLFFINMAPVSSLAKECEISDKNRAVSPIDPIWVVDADAEKMVPYRYDYTKVNPIESHTSFEFPCQTDWPEWISTRRLKSKGSGIITNELAQTGSQSLKVTLTPGAYVSGGWRAEVRDLNNAKRASEVWYQISTYIPSMIDGKSENFPSYDPRVETKKIKNADGSTRFEKIIQPDNPNFYIFHQFHDAYIPGTYRASSPPLALRYRAGRLMVTLMNNHIFDIYENNEGESGKNGAVIVFEKDDNDYKDRWLNFTYQIQWSAFSEQENQLNPGFIRIWLEGKKILECHGEIGTKNILGPYVKFGVYAKRDVISPRVAYHDSYRRALRGSPGYEKIISKLSEKRTIQNLGSISPLKRREIDAKTKLSCDQKVYLYDHQVINLQ